MIGGHVAVRVAAAEDCKRGRVSRRLRRGASFASSNDGQACAFALNVAWSADLCRTNLAETVPPSSWLTKSEPGIESELIAKPIKTTTLHRCLVGRSLSN